MFHSLQQDHLVIYHLLVAFDILFEDYFDRIFRPCTLGFSYDAVRPSTQSPAKLVLRSEIHDQRRDECFTLNV